MTTATSSTALVTIQPVFTDAERLALAEFLAGYRGLTRDAYSPHPRQVTTWCRARSLPLFSVRRADIELFARELEARGRARATVTRRLCPIAGFCKYAVEEELLDHSPAARVRRPRLDYESHATALDRNELGALLVAAGRGPSAEHALISLLGLNSLRVSEATSADIQHLGLERSHRTLTMTRKNGKAVTIPLAPRTARAIDLAIGERTEGPLFLGGDGRRLDLHGAARIVRRVTRRAGIDKHVTPTRSGTRSSPPPSTPECRCGTCRKPPPTPTRAPRCGTTGRAPAWTGMRLTWSRCSSPEQPGNPAPTCDGLAAPTVGPSRARTTSEAITARGFDCDREPPDLGGRKVARRRREMACRTG
jgi:integrase/recombinase XerD